jgi:rod shape-determining protein MreD
MKLSLVRRLDLWSRNTIPFVLSVSLILLSVVPLRLLLQNPVLPSLPLIAVYYWTLYRPDLMPPAAAFAIGLLTDVLTGAPLGVNAFVFIVVHGLVNLQRKFFEGRPFSIVWLGFTVVAAGAFLLAWLLVSAFYGRGVNGSGAVLQLAATIGCLPFIWWLLVRCHRAILRPA